MGEQFQNWIENIIETRLGQELNTRVAQYCQETLNTFEQKFNTQIEQMFQNKATSFEEKIKEKLKNEKEEFFKQSYVEFEQNCLLFEQSLTLKLEEMIETKSQELSVKFEAQIIKELEQVMSVIQQILNNGLDLDKNIEKELHTKFEEYLQGHKWKLDEVLEVEVNKKIKDSLTTKHQFVNEILEKKVNVCLKQIMESKYQQINLKLDKQVNKTVKELLDNKMQLLKLTSDDNSFENMESSQSIPNRNLNYEQIKKNDDEIQKTVDPKECEKSLESVNSKIKALEEELKQKKDDNKKYEKSFDDLYKKINEMEAKFCSSVQLNNTKGKYANWEPRHEHLKECSFVSCVDFVNIFNRIENLNVGNNNQNAEIIRIFNSMKIHTVTPTKRFPVDDVFIDLNDGAVKMYIKIFYKYLLNDPNIIYMFNSVHGGRNVDIFIINTIKHIVQDKTPGKKFRKFDMFEFEKEYGLIWSEN